MFNSPMQPTQIGLGNGVNSQNLLKLQYSYGSTNNNGNVQSQTITVPGVAHDFVQSYTYDELNRLTNAGEIQNSTQTWEQTFTYDRFGNRNFNEAETTTLPKNCGTAPSLTVCAADKKIVNPSVNTANNRLSTSDNYAFDNAGNTTRDAESRRFTYDAENKQTKVETLDANGNPIATIGEYFYDGDGKRVKKVVPGGETTVFVYDAGGKLIQEHSTVVQPIQDAKTVYTTNDHLGSPRINTDATGQIISRHDYRPFGEEVDRTGYGSDTVRKQFTGYERDIEIEMDFAQARYYGHSRGRFTSPDNFANDTHPADPASWNLYAYARNNPLYLVDPNGEKVYVGNIANQADHDEFLRRANYTYGCESCVGVDADGYLTINTSGLSQSVINATQFLTNAINSTDPSQLFDVQITNNNPDVAFGDSQAGMGNAPTGISSIRIRLDFGDDVYLRGNAQLQASFLNLVFAHEVSHFAPDHKRDPTTPGVRGRVDNPINEIRLSRGLPLRAEYQARDLHVGGLVYLRFGDAVAGDDGSSNGIGFRPARGSDGIEVMNQPGRIILWWQNRIKK